MITVLSVTVVGKEMDKNKGNRSPVKKLGSTGIKEQVVWSVIKCLTVLFRLSSYSIVLDSYLNQVRPRVRSI